MSQYEVWDLTGGSLLGNYPTEAEALAWIRRCLDNEGPDFVVELALDGRGADGQRRLIAEGHDLVELARTVAPASIG